MNVNYTELIKNVKGTFVQKPLSGTLSGHQQESLLTNTFIVKSKSNYPIIHLDNMNI